ncbi:MAG TPA: hypothetical protein VE631_02980 [Alphaproteobacteria bacterium]|jgi:DNA-binding beta-propeller fold protein YncE|nr:hypothetical protein [Alphaproteobacteria bacterium]
MRRLFLAFAVCAAAAATAPARPAPPPPLRREATIALPDTSGRIDHLAIDIARKRLFVAELGNGSVDVADLGARRVIHRIAGLNEPQGIVYVPKADRLVVASGGDGTVRTFDGNGYAPRGQLDLGDDADNVRLDPRTGHVVVGFGGGGLAIIDPAGPAKLSVIALPGHPEGFQLSGGRVHVNVPDARQIDVADLAAGTLTGSWTTGSLTANFPMAVDDDGHVAVVFRGQDRFVLLDAASGRPAARTDTCGDADDVFFDSRRKRFMVSCGAGAVDVLALDGARLRSLARIPTSPGARTGLFVPALDRLFIAAPAGPSGHDASIQVFRAMP